MCATAGSRKNEEKSFRKNALAMKRITRQRWRVRIETPLRLHAMIGSSGSPARDGGCGLKQALTAITLIQSEDHPPEMAGAD